MTFQVGTTGLVLQWAQPFASIGNGPGASNSLAVYLLDASGNIVFSSTDNDVGHDPEVNITYNNTSSGTAALRLVVVQNGDTIPSGQLFKVVSESNSPVFNSPNAGKGSGTLLGHEMLPGINVVGAVNYQNTPAFGVTPAKLETFSSSGPGDILFDPNGNALATPIVPNEPQFAATD